MRIRSWGYQGIGNPGDHMHLLMIAYPHSGDDCDPRECDHLCKRGVDLYAAGLVPAQPKGSR